MEIVNALAGENADTSRLGEHSSNPQFAEPWRRNLARLADKRLVGSRGAWWWTGVAPVAGQCPGVDQDGRISSLPQPNLATCTREQALAYFDNSWTLTEVLFSALQTEEAFYRPPFHHLRHPLIFYYCHPASLYVNKLRIAALLEGPLDETFEHLFETGVDEMSWDDMSKNDLLWPTVAEVNWYRRQVYGLVRNVLETHPDLADGHAPITRQSPLWALFMGFEHERIHLETSSVLIRELPLNLLARPLQWPADHATAMGGSIEAPLPEGSLPQNELVAAGGIDVTLGKPSDWPSFGWDNEYGERHVTVRPFKASRFLVSNGEFHAFVKAGGYAERRFWSEDGWSWRKFRNAKWPTFWVPAGPQGLHEYKLRTCFEEMPMPWSWPAEVNCFEARAFCHWRAERDETPYRLVTEAEHHSMRDAATRDVQLGTARDPVMTASGTQFGLKGINVNLAFGSPTPVNASPVSSSGFHDTLGNVWEWCEDDFNPLPGFKADALYEDFSTPCFDGKHTLILGGSFASTGDEASIWARFHFRPHFGQHAGFRLACSANGDPSCDAVKIGEETLSIDVYETRQALDEYLLLHFGEPTDQMPYAFGPQGAVNFPSRCAQLVLDAAKQVGITGGRALDLGCAVGRATFELARGFDEVIGVDLSHGFVDAAHAIQQTGHVAYRLKDEGDLGAELVAGIDPAIDRTRVSFSQADACALPEDFVGFDAVLMANLLCRLPSPRLLLERLAGPCGLVRPGGLLVLVSPYTWMDKFTPKETWLGGYYERDGAQVRSADALKSFLATEFELLKEQDLPLVIREHVRKYQFIVSHAMVWRRLP